MLSAERGFRDSPFTSKRLTIPVTSLPSTRPLSPCVQICRVDQAAKTCEGCGRTLDEIAGWGHMTETEKAPVWARLEAQGYWPPSGSKA